MRRNIWSDKDGIMRRWLLFAGICMFIVLIMWNYTFKSMHVVYYTPASHGLSVIVFQCGYHRRCLQMQAGNHLQDTTNLPWLGMTDVSVIISHLIVSAERY